MTDDTQPEAMDLANWLEAVGGGPSAKRRADCYDSLVERVKELERALGEYMSAFGQALEAHGILFAQQQICADEMARAALSKALPNAAAKEAS